MTQPPRGEALIKRQTTAAVRDAAPVHAGLIIFIEQHFNHRGFDQHLAARRAHDGIEKLLNFLVLSRRGPHANDAGLRIGNHRCGFAVGHSASRGGFGAFKLTAVLGAVSCERLIGFTSFLAGSRRDVARGVLLNASLADDVCTPFGKNLVGFFEQILNVINERDPKLVLRGIRYAGRGIIAAARTASTLTARTARRRNLRCDGDLRCHVPRHVDVIDFVIAQKRRIGQHH